MGLDMHLHTKTGYEIYWRKANHIHNWFADRLGDTDMGEGLHNGAWYPVSVEMLQDLVETCEDVLKHKEDTEYARNKLPRCAGFFFGPQEYNEGYYNSLEYTIKEINSLLKNSISGEEFFYSGDW